MNDYDLLKENFYGYADKIKKDFYKIEFHHVFANSFGNLTQENRSFSVLLKKFEKYVGDYFCFYRLMKRLVSCGVLKRVQPIKQIGFHKGLFWNEYKRVVNETWIEYDKFLEMTIEEKPDELKKEDLKVGEHELSSRQPVPEHDEEQS